MRNKPTIIAFKTPSLENAKARKSTSVDMGLSKIFNQKDAEEGVVAKVAEDGKKKLAMKFQEFTNNCLLLRLFCHRVIRGGGCQLPSWQTPRDIHRWTLWCSVQSHIPRTTRGFNWHRNRSYTICFHPPVDHAPVLEGSELVP